MNVGGLLAPFLQWLHMKMRSMFLVVFAMLGSVEAEERTLPEINSAFSIFDARLQSKVWKQDIGALSVAVLWQGNIVWASSYSSKDNAKSLSSDSPYRIGSVTKSITATAILQLRDEGKLQLNDALRVYVHAPETAELFNVSLHQLLTHSAGWPREVEFNGKWGLDAFPNRTAFLNALSQASLRSVPGTEWHYSNAAYAALGLVVEHVSGVSYDEYVHKNIFSPLGMSHSYVTPNKMQSIVGDDWIGPGLRSQHADFVDMSLLSAAGNIASTVTDLARFSRLFFNDGVSNVLKTTSAKQMHALQWKDGESDSGWGYGWGIARGGKLMQHEGSVPGFTSVVSLRPDESYGVIALCNRTDSLCGDVVAMAFNTVLPILREYGKEVSLSAKTIIASKSLVRFAAADGAEWAILNHNGKQIIVDLSQRDVWKERIILHEITVDRFRMEGGELSGEMVQFERNKSSDIVALQLPGFAMKRQPQTRIQE